MELIFEDLSKKIIKAAFKVYNTLGYGYQEKEYQKAIAEEFKAIGLIYSQELYSDLFYEGVKIRGYFVDFLVEEAEKKIIVEIKVASRPHQRNFYQVFQYLKNYNLPLGLIIVFSPTGIIIKRVVNLK